MALSVKQLLTPVTKDQALELQIDLLKSLGARRATTGRGWWFGSATVADTRGHENNAGSEEVGGNRHYNRWQSADPGARDKWDEENLAGGSRTMRGGCLESDRTEPAAMARPVLRARCLGQRLLKALGTAADNRRTNVVIRVGVDDPLGPVLLIFGRARWAVQLGHPCLGRAEPAAPDQRQHQASG